MILGRRERREESHFSLFSFPTCFLKGGGGEKGEKRGGGEGKN